MHQLKFTGTAEIPFALDRDRNYTIAGEFEEISRTETQGDDEIITTFKVAPLKLMAINDAGEKIRLKTKNKNSTRIRAAIYRAQQERTGFFLTQDREEYYDAFTNKLVQPENLQAVLDLLNL
jgi:hypothetical protein